MDGAVRRSCEALWERPTPDVTDFDDILAVQARGIDAEEVMRTSGLDTDLSTAQGTTSGTRCWR